MAEQAWFELQADQEAALYEESMRVQRELEEEQKSRPPKRARVSPPLEASAVNKAGDPESQSSSIQEIPEMEEMAEPKKKPKLKLEDFRELLDELLDYNEREIEAQRLLIDHLYHMNSKKKTAVEMMREMLKNSL